MGNGETTRRDSKLKSNSDGRSKPDGPQNRKNSNVLIIAAVLLLLLGLFVAYDNPQLTRVGVPSQTNTKCGSPLKTIENWHVRHFRPKWFGLFGGPDKITYRTWSRKARQISVVDLDSRDIEIRMRVDGVDQGHNDVQLDPSVHCGDNVKNCIDMGFGSALILVPPGRHKVTAEIVDRNGDFAWGKESKRRVMWNVQECP